MTCFWENSSIGLYFQNFSQFNFPHCVFPLLSKMFWFILQWVLQRDGTHRYKSYIIILLKYFKWWVQVEMVYEQTVEREQVVNFEGVNKSNASNIMLRAKFLFEQRMYCMWDVKILWVHEQSNYLRCVDVTVVKRSRKLTLMKICSVSIYHIALNIK